MIEFALFHRVKLPVADETGSDVLRKYMAWEKCKREENNKKILRIWNFSPEADPPLAEEVGI